MKISICIPTYGMKGEGAKYLNQNLASITIQSLQPHEVIISDHSTDDLVEQEANRWKEILNIRYFRNGEKIGSISGNSNGGLTNFVKTREREGIKQSGIKEKILNFLL